MRRKSDTGSIMAVWIESEHKWFYEIISLEYLATNWQQKSDSPYPMENTDNQNVTNHIAQAKLLKSGFQGAKGKALVHIL